MGVFTPVPNIITNFSGANLVAEYHDATWNTIDIGTHNVSGTYAVVPVPAATWLMGSGLIGLVGVARRRRKAAA